MTLLSLPRTQERVIESGLFTRNWRRFFADIERKEMVSGELIESQALVPFADNTIAHNLNRAPKGWLIVRDQGDKCELSVYRNAADNSIAQGAHKIEFDAETYDYGGDYDSSTNYRFDAPVQGTYSVTVVAGISSSTDAFNVTLYKNGSEVLNGWEAKGLNLHGTVHEPRMHLAKNDYIEGYIYQGDATARNLITGNGSTRMMVSLVRETWDDQDNNSTPEDSLVLRTTYAHTVSLWVF